MRIEAVIFDCDGVLVDSEAIGNRVFAEAATAAGAPMSSTEAFALFRGRKMADCVALIEGRLGRAVAPDFVDELRARMAACFKNEVRAVDGIEFALDRLARPFCVASSGPAEKIRLTLGLTGLLPRFDGRIFSSYDVGSWKPEPDLFLHAARAMGSDPAACAVVEDTVWGVRSGVRAGMAVYGFAPVSPTSPDDARLLAAEGARVFSDMRLLPGLLDG
ncbi:MAG: HAD-IA family hydrolase [Thermoanaerobaculia bacterium]